MDTAEPLLANPAGGDFHQLAGSPTIDAGTTPAIGLGKHRPRRRGPQPGLRSPTSARTSSNLITPSAPDTTAPETTITKQPKKKVKSKRRRAKAKFKFTSSEAGSSFECKLDKGAFKGCSSPFVRKVKRGKQSVSVCAADSSGNVDPTPARVVWKLKRKRGK